ncbi:MAG: DUF2069 domain-containing protein [Povalibacter sp.]
MSPDVPVPGSDRSVRTWRTACIAFTLLLIALLFAWHLHEAPTVARAAMAFGLSLPLLAPLPGLWRSHRRTFAWATLCVIPYFVVGITESIANPANRPWSAPCLALSLLLFVGLIAYLRVTRPT